MPVAVSPLEPWGADTLTAGGTVLGSDAYPRTNQILRRDGLTVVELPVSVCHKAEGALTCMSLLLRDIPPRPVNRAG